MGRSWGKCARGRAEHRSREPAGFTHSRVGSTCRLNHSYGSPGNLIHFGENLGKQIAEPKKPCEPAKFGPL